MDAFMSVVIRFDFLNDTNLCRLKNNLTQVTQECQMQSQNV